MRVITGKARGKQIKTVDKTDVVRPTSQRVKEAIFSAIQFDILGANVLDLFSGSGQLGIEALSREAKSCTFVDHASKSIDVIYQNLEYTCLKECAKVVKSDYNSFLDRNIDIFNVVFLDPPYNNGILEKVVPMLEKSLTDGTFVVCEHQINELNEDILKKFAKFTVHKQYKYGKIGITILKFI